MPKSNSRQGANGYSQRTEAAITRGRHYSWSKDFLNSELRAVTVLILVSLFLAGTVADGESGKSLQIQDVLP